MAKARRQRSVPSPPDALASAGVMADLTTSRDIATNAFSDLTKVQVPAHVSDACAGTDHLITSTN